MDLTEGFSYTGSAQNFERDSYATLAEMKAVKAKKMPNIFIATCEETGKLYIYNKQNEDDEVLGKWREVSGGSSAGGSSGSIPTYEVGGMSTEESLLSTDVVVEEIQKHTDQVFFIKQYNAYESRTWFVTYSPFINYRRSNKWTATYSNKLIVIDKYADTTNIPTKVQTFTLGASENLFNNNGPELDIYSFTQGHISSNEMLSEIGDNYYASYSGDYGRGNEPFIPGQVESRADSCTVYIENAPRFGTQECKLFAVNTIGEVFEGFFVTQNTTPTFTNEGLIWRKVGDSNNSSSAAPIYNLSMESVEGEQNFPEYSYERFCFRREQNLLTAVKGDLHDAPEVGVFVKYNKSSYDGYPEFYQLAVFGYSDAGMDMPGRKWVFKPLIDKDGRGTIIIKYNPYNTEINEGYSVEEAVAAEVPEEETDTIDFSTWEEFQNPEANGIVLDGQGGANVDGSNVGVDPDDIEPDD